VCTLREDVHLKTKEEFVAEDAKVRKHFRLSQRKIDEARKALGTKTDTETVEAALDLVTFRREVMEGLERIGGTRTYVDVLREGDVDPAAG
jgi:hypothetical protein